MEKQLWSVHRTSYNLRILHFDATGGLAKILQKYSKSIGKDIPNLLSYFMILKNYDTLEFEDGHTLIGELLSSQHDVPSIRTFLWNYRSKYYQIRLR
jgi:hypothetical protein